MNSKQSTACFLNRSSLYSCIDYSPRYPCSIKHVLYINISLCQFCSLVRITLLWGSDVVPDCQYNLLTCRHLQILRSAASLNSKHSIMFIKQVPQFSNHIIGQYSSTEVLSESFIYLVIKLHYVTVCANIIILKHMPLYLTHLLINNPARV